MPARRVLRDRTISFAGRGWNSVENAYSNLLQANLHERGLELCHVQLPLIFVKPGYQTLLRSAWGPLTERGRFYPPARVDDGAVNSATQQIVSFIKQEEIRGTGLAIQVQNDPGFHSILNAEQNLLGRIMCARSPGGPVTHCYLRTSRHPTVHSPSTLPIHSGAVPRENRRRGIQGVFREIHRDARFAEARGDQLELPGVGRYPRRRNAGGWCASCRRP